MNCVRGGGFSCATRETKKAFLMTHRHFAAAALVFLSFLGFIGWPAPACAGQASKPPQAPPAAQSAHKTYLSWNPLDLFLSGRLSFGVEHIFRFGNRYFGFYAQYTSPMNSIMNGMVTSGDTADELADEIQFPRSLEFFVNFYGKGRAKALRSYPRIGLSLMKNPAERDSAVYLAIGPCGRLSLGRNFHVTLALTTLKFKLWGGRNYNWLQFPFLNFTVGIDF